MKSKLLHLGVALSSVVNLLFAQTTYWQATNGPHPVPAVNAVVLGAENTLYAGGINTGLCASTNQGMTWSYLGGGDALKRINGIWSGGDPKITYVSVQSGVFRTTDRGVNWREISPMSAAERPASYAVAPNGVVFRVGAAWDFNVYNEDCFLRSSDYGDTWRCLGDTLRWDGGSLLAITSSGAVLRGKAGRVYRSTDNGDSWSVIKVDTLGQYCGALVAGHDGFVIAAVQDSNVSRYQYYRSMNDGLSWLRLTTMPSTTGVTFAFSPNGNEIYLLSDSLYRSTDLGESWVRSKPYDPTLPAGSAPSFTSMVVDSFGCVIVGTRRDVLRSTDRGATWQKPSSGVPSHAPIMGLGAARSGIIFAGASDSSFSSTDKGDTWNLIHGPSTSITEHSSGRLFGVRAANGDYWSPIWVSTDQGMSWKESSPISGSSSSPAFTSYVGVSTLPTGTITYCANFHNPMYSPSWGPLISISLDTGSTYSTQYYEYYDRSNSGNSRGANCMASVGTTALVGLTRGILRSTDDGVSWENSNTGLPSGSFDVKRLAVDSTGLVYVMLSVDPGIYISSDSGATWSAAGGTAPSAQSLTDMVAGPQGWLFVSTTNQGVLRAQGAGGSWSPLNDGLPNLNVTCLVIDNEGHLLAGMGGGGVYRSVERATDVREQAPERPGTFVLEQNYPNPFNPTTVVSYQLPVAINVKLVVYDMLGREVAVLADEKKEPGSYEVKFDGSGLASGVYFYRLQAGSFVETRKLLLLR